MAEVTKSEKKITVDAKNEVSGFYLVNNTSDAKSSPEKPSTTEDQTATDIPRVDLSASVEEATDELSVLLSERVDGNVDHREPLFVPKNPMPDPELVALAKSIESCYEQSQQERTDGSKDNSGFDFTSLSRSSSMLPPPRKTSSWLRIGAFAAAAAVFALTSAAGGWYAALNSTHAMSFITPLVATPSVHHSTTIATQVSAENVETPPPMLLQSAPESSEPLAKTAPAGLSSLTEQPSVDDEKSYPSPVADQPRDIVDRRESSSEASKTERSPARTTARKVAVNADPNDVSPSESPEVSAAISQSDQTKSESVESIESENAISAQATETAQATAEAHTAAESAPDNSLFIPQVLTREQVAAGFKAIYQRISQCAAGKHGIAKIKATLSGNGRVTFALVDGAFKGSPEGSCMARAVRKTTFPEFAQSKLTVEFPYML